MALIKRSLFTTGDCFCLVIVSFFAISTRLWLIVEPEQVIYDEGIHGNFTNWHIQKRFHFDVNPPLANLIMAAVARLTQYRGEIDFASKFSNPFQAHEHHYVSQRITPAIFSAFTSPLIYAGCRCLRIGTIAATCAAVILTSDVSMIVEGRFILPDGVFHFFCALHIFCLCHFMAAPRTWRAVAAGASLGAAVSCKQSAIGLMGLDAAGQIIWFLLGRVTLSRIVKQSFFVAVSGCVVFLGTWIWYFVTHPYDGLNSDLLESQFASSVIPRAMANYTYWGDRIRGAELLSRIWFWNRLTRRLAQDLVQWNPHQSDPWRWPLLMDRWVTFFWGDSDREIHCIGTPFVYWFSSVGLCFGLVGFLIGKSDWVNLLLLCGWASTFAPFVIWPNSGFLFHYLVPLMLAVMHFAAVMEKWLPVGYKAGISFAFTAMCLVCFVFFSPWAYATPCPDCNATRVWNEEWLYGPMKKVTLVGRELFTTTEMYLDFPM